MMNNLLVILADEKSGETSNEIFGISKPIFFAIVAAIAVLCLFIVYLIYFSTNVNRDEQAVVERFDKYKKTVSEKLLLLIPIADKVVFRSDSKPKVYNFNNSFTVSDKNGSLYNLSLSVTYRIIDAKNYYYSGGNAEDTLENTINDEMCKYLFKKTIKNPMDIRQMNKDDFIKIINDGKLSESGLAVLGIDFRDVVEISKSQKNK